MRRRRAAAAVAARVEPDPIAGASASLLAASGGGMDGDQWKWSRGFAFGAFDARQAKQMPRGVERSVHVPFFSFLFLARKCARIFLFLFVLLVFFFFFEIL